MFKTRDLRQKEVINVRTAEKIGFIEDVDIDFESGKIRAVIVPRKKIFFFLPGEDYIIPWENIVKVGHELILVDYAEFIGSIDDESDF